jgi:hypothetical protein
MSEPLSWTAVWLQRAFSKPRGLADDLGAIMARAAQPEADINAAADRGAQLLMEEVIRVGNGEERGAQGISIADIERVGYALGCVLLEFSPANKLDYKTITHKNDLLRATSPPWRKHIGFTYVNSKVY